MKITIIKTIHNAAIKYSLLLLIGLVSGWFATSSPCFAYDAYFDWSMPEGFRYFSVGIDDDSDGFADNFNYLTDPRFQPILDAIQHNYDYQVNVDGSQTGVIKYKWTYENFNRVTGLYEIKRFETDTGTASLYFGKEGTYNVTLEVTFAGNQTASITKRVIVQDWLIVAAGDSQMSGEGNPDVPSAMWDAYQDFLATISPMTIEELYERRNETATLQALWQTYLSLDASPWAGWTDALCDRSQNSGWVLAGQDIDSCDNKTSVTFVHLACSGAIVEHGLIGPFQGTAKLGFFDYEYCHTHTDCIPPQIEQARQLVGSREIDALMLSIGGNDVYVFPMIMNLMFWPHSESGPEGGPIDPTPILNKLCSETLPNNLTSPNIQILQGYCANYIGGFYQPPYPFLKPAVQFFADNIGLLPGYYQELDDYIGDTLNLHKDRIYITELPNMTKDENGNYCCSETGNACIQNPFVMIPEVSWAEMLWGDSAPTQTFNNIIHANTDRGWNIITGIYDDFANHGYCSSDTYLTRWYEVSLRENLGFAFYHPNEAGHDVYRNRIAAALRDHFYVNGDCNQGIKLIPQQPNIDNDGISDPDDNCPSTPNGPLLGTCVKAVSGVVVGMGATCNSNGDCATGETCDLAQGDINGNGCGDACECYADVNDSGKVDLSDLVIMKGEFAKPCPPSPCTADLNGDDKVDLSDLVVMKMQFLKTGCPC